jgi:hypothetical protein
MPLHFTQGWMGRRKFGGNWLLETVIQYIIAWHSFGRIQMTLPDLSWFM